MSVERRSNHPEVIAAALVLAALVGVVAIASIWANRQLLDTDGWVSTSGDLIDNHDVRHRIAGFLGEELVAETEGQLLAAGEVEVAERVMPRLRREQTRLAERVIATPRFGTLWETANRAGQRALLRALDESGDSGSGAVVVELTPALRQLANEVGEEGLAQELGASDLGARVRPEAGQIEVLEAGELDPAQDIVSAVRHLTAPAVIVALVLYGIALFLGRRRLPRAFLGIGVALVATGVLALVARAVAGHEIVDRLLDRQSDRDAADAAWGVATSTIAHLSIGAIVVGALIAIGSLAAGYRRRPIDESGHGE